MGDLFEWVALIAVIAISSCVFNFCIQMYAFKVMFAILMNVRDASSSQPLQFAAKIYIKAYLCSECF